MKSICIDGSKILTYFINMGLKIPDANVIMEKLNKQMDIRKYDCE